MAIRLQFLTIIVPRANFARCKDLPGYFRELNPEAGILFETTWYDRHLYCETAMDSGEDIIEKWETRGLVGLDAASGGKFWEDFCVAASGRGLGRPCGWLEYSRDVNAVWLAGTEKGALVGGYGDLESSRKKMAASEAAGEKAYHAMYESRHPHDEYEDAMAALSGALNLARFLHQAEDVERFGKRAEHICAVYRSQFRMGS